VNQFKYTGTAGAVTSQQRSILSSLLASSRMSRLFDAEVLLGDKAYTPVDLVDDLQAGLFVELKEEAPKIDPIRRALQRSYVDILKNEFTPAPAVGDFPTLPRGRAPGLGDFGPRVNELRAVARVALGKLEKELGTAKGKAKDPATVAHLADLQSEIKSILSDDKK